MTRWPDGQARIVGTPAERFWPKVHKSDGCWLWQGSKNPKGYGTFADGGTKSAHRVSYEMAHGPIRDGLHVLHRCDTPACVRPEHLFLGDNRANQQDCSAKGRHHSQRVHSAAAKLTPSNVRRVRALQAAGASYSEIAAEFGISKGGVGHIINGRYWKGV